MRFVRICKIQFQPFGNSNSILNGFSRISPKHHGKRFFSRGFFHLGVPLQVLLFLTPLHLCCHPVFQISQWQCNRGSVAVSYPHTFLSLEDSLRAFESTKQFCSKSLESFIMGEYILIVFKWFSKKLMGMANYKMVPFIYCRNK